MPVQVALFRGTVSWLSKVIEWDTRSKYCHAAILMRDGSLVESIEPTGVRRVADWQNNSPSEPADLFTVAGVADEAVEAFLVAQIGKPYAMLDLVGFITRDDRDEDRGGWFCSELAFAAIAAGGVELLRDIAPFQVSPGILALSPLLIRNTP